MQNQYIVHHSVQMCTGMYIIYDTTCQQKAGLADLVRYLLANVTGTSLSSKDFAERLLQALGKQYICSVNEKSGLDSFVFDINYRDHPKIFHQHLDPLHISLSVNKSLG